MDRTILFYGKTWILWACALMIGMFAIFGCIMGPLFLLGVIHAADGRPGYEAGIPMTAIGVLFTPIVISVIFQLWALQKPILVLYKEGIRIRSIGAPFQGGFSGLGLILIILTAFWNLITGKTFHLSTQYFAWEEIKAVIPERGNLVIVAQTEPEEGASWDTNDAFTTSTFSYGPDSFSVPTQKVGTTLAGFYYHADSRNSLPSWQDVGSDTW